MGRLCKSLRGRSEFIRADGTVLPLRDFDGTLLCSPEELAEVRAAVIRQVRRPIERKIAAMGVKLQAPQTIDAIELLKTAVKEGTT